MSLAFVFPGQGSQSVGMMSAYGDAPVIRATFDEASASLGEDLWQMVVDGPADFLAQTVNTQPVMLTAGVAVWRFWLELGGKVPTLCAGHSLGEYTALVAAGVLSLEQAVPLVRLRAAAMQEAVPIGMGAMAAVLGLDDGAVIAACQDAAQGEIVEAVNFNALGQTVIAGNRDAVARAITLCQARGAKRALALPVSAPFHSSLMRPAAEKLALALSAVEFNAPQIPVLNNVDVSIETASEKIKAALVRQADHPVRWVETMQKMAGMGVSMVAECGPGKVLSGLVKRCVDHVSSVSLHDVAAIKTNLFAE